VSPSIQRPIAVGFLWILSTLTFLYGAYETLYFYWRAAAEPGLTAIWERKIEIYGTVTVVSALAWIAAFWVPLRWQAGTNKSR